MGRGGCLRVKSVWVGWRGCLRVQSVTREGGREGGREKEREREKKEREKDERETQWRVPEGPLTLKQREFRIGNKTWSMGQRRVFRIRNNEIKTN